MRCFLATKNTKGNKGGEGNGRKNDEGTKRRHEWEDEGMGGVKRGVRRRTGGREEKMGGGGRGGTGIAPAGIGRKKRGQLMATKFEKPILLQKKRKELPEKGQVGKSCRFLLKKLPRHDGMGAKKR